MREYLEKKGKSTLEKNMIRIVKKTSPNILKTEEFESKTNKQNGK